MVDQGSWWWRRIWVFEREGFLGKVYRRVHSRLHMGLRHWGWREWVCSERGEGIGKEARRGFIRRLLEEAVLCT